MGKSQRSKGRRGQTEAESVLRDRDWQTDPITCGVKREDIVATDPTGQRWAVEVKNCTIINLKQFRLQARTQAKTRKLAWMLMVKIPGTQYWYVERKNEMPVLWKPRIELEIQG